MTDGDSQPAGSGSVTAVWFMGSLVELKATAAETGGAYAVTVHTIPPGLNPAPAHRHADKNEGFYVLDGSLTVQLGGDWREVAAGTFLYIPRGTVHGIWNRTAAPARLLAVFEPAGFEQFFVELGVPAESGAPPPPLGPPDLARLHSVAARYRTEIVPPASPNA